MTIRDGATPEDILEAFENELQRYEAGIDAMRKDGLPVEKYFGTPVELEERSKLVLELFGSIRRVKELQDMKIAGMETRISGLESHMQDLEGQLRTEKVHAQKLQGEVQGLRVQQRRR
jgi:hypothetical protein